MFLKFKILIKIFFKICTSFNIFHIVFLYFSFFSNGKIIYSTKSNNGVINGVPSFISQEEFDRFTAIWWSPGPEKMLLYEKVDEKLVTELQFTCPGHMPSPIMRYPLAGMANAKSSLRLIVISATEVNFIGSCDFR